MLLLCEISPANEWAIIENWSNFSEQRSGDCVSGPRKEGTLCSGNSTNLVVIHPTECPFVTLVSVHTHPVTEWQMCHMLCVIIDADLNCLTNHPYFFCSSRGSIGTARVQFACETLREAKLFANIYFSPSAYRGNWTLLTSSSREDQLYSLVVKLTLMW